MKRMTTPPVRKVVVRGGIGADGVSGRVDIQPEALRDRYGRHGDTASPAKWRAIKFTKDVSADTVFCTTGNALLAQLRANEAGTRAGKDPEYLHQMRVTVRRLRALLSIYPDLPHQTVRERADRALKRLGRALGAARDADVFVYDIWPQVRTTLSQGAVTNDLHATWLSQQQRAAHQVSRVLTAPQYQRLLRELIRCFSIEDGQLLAECSFAGGKSAKHFASGVLQRRFRRPRRYGRSLGKLDNLTLHRLRIEIKRLRYTMETFGSLFKTSRVDRLQSVLAELQDILGAMHDCVVAEEKIAAALVKIAGPGAARLQLQIEKWQILRLNGLKRKLKGAWRKFRHAESFW